MPRQWSPCFLVLPMLLVWHYTTQWSSGTAPVLLMAHYATPVVTWLSTMSGADLREHFLLSDVFYLALFSAFSRLPWGDSSASKLARHHANLWNIAPAQLFFWTKVIHKRFICGRFYLKARSGKSWNINLHGELVLRNISFEIFTSDKIWTLFAKGEHDTSHKR